MVFRYVLPPSKMLWQSILTGRDILQIVLLPVIVSIDHPDSVGIPDNVLLAVHRVHVLGVMLQREDWLGIHGVVRWSHAPLLALPMCG